MDSANPVDIAETNASLGTVGDEDYGPGTLERFAYGEHLEGTLMRSLGFRLLTPTTPESWSAEVEMLARRLQAAPFPDHWPRTDLFCSVLLADGQRLVAIARYGLIDHTPSERRGGLELVGVIGANTMSVSAARTIVQWLRRERETTEDLRNFTGSIELRDVLIDHAPPPPMGEAVPVLPIRLWQEGGLIFAASTPNDPDLRLSMLDQSAGSTWQWLPLIGPDFPLTMYAHRGPLVAWTPHMTGVAIRLNPTAPMAPSKPTSWEQVSWPWRIAWGSLTLLLLINLWLTSRIESHPNAVTAADLLALKHANESPKSPPTNDQPMPLLAQSEASLTLLYSFLRDNGCFAADQESELIAIYEKLQRTHPHLRSDSTEGKQVIGWLSRQTPAQRSRQVERVIRDASKGIDPDIVTMILTKVKPRLQETAIENGP